MFAAKPYLFGINVDLSPQDPEEIVKGRFAACDEHAPKLDPLERFGCPRASVGHPNPEGAQRYAEAILEQVRLALPALLPLATPPPAASVRTASSAPPAG
jgi:hypothetical protein